MKEFYVYVHRKKDNGEIFYVGKGKGGRHSHTYGKSKWWESIARKHGWYSEIMISNISECCALSIEKMAIHANRRKICNISSGGMCGLAGIKKSEDHIRKVALKQTGRPKSYETRIKISEKAKERLKDKRKHWHLKLIDSYWQDGNGNTFKGNHLDLSLTTGYPLGALKKVQNGSINSYKGWRLIRDTDIRN